MKNNFNYIFFKCVKVIFLNIKVNWTIHLSVKVVFEVKNYNFNLKLKLILKTILFCLKRDINIIIISSYEVFEPKTRRST